MLKTRDFERTILTHAAALTTAILTAGVMRSSPARKKMCSAGARAVLGLFLLFAVAESSSAQTCKGALAARQNLVKVSDQLGRKIAKMKPCSQAQIATAQKRHKAMSAVISTGDWIVKNCPGYESNKAARDRNLSTLRALASVKNVCAATGALDKELKARDEELDALEELIE